jgi:hypothetical protein
MIPIASAHVRLTTNGMRARSRQLFRKIRIEAALPENQEELKNMAEWYSKADIRTKERHPS